VPPALNPAIGFFILLSQSFLNLLALDIFFVRRLGNGEIVLFDKKAFTIF